MVDEVKTGREKAIEQAHVIFPRARDCVAALELFAASKKLRIREWKDTVNYKDGSMIVSTFAVVLSDGKTAENGASCTETEIASFKGHDQYKGTKNFQMSQRPAPNLKP